MTIEPLDPIPLSALQHWAYCPRQCTLIHVEQGFEENLFTQRGQALHKRVDDPGFELRDGLRIERALPLLQKGNLFIAVGALHLSGKEGLVELLRAVSGRDVRQAGAGRRFVLRHFASAAGGGGRCRFAGENRAGCGRGSAPARGQHFAAALERRPLPRLLLARSLPAGSPGADAGTCGRPAFPVRSG